MEILLRRGLSAVCRRSFGTTSIRTAPLVTTENMDRIRLIGINRPEKRNCVNSETADLLLSAFEEFDADDNVDVAVLFGHRGNFCAGYDLEELATCDSEIMERFRQRRPMGPTGMLTRKPTVAAIQGYAVAGGLELALWCDQRVVEDTAVMGVFCRRFGVPLLDGGTVRLPQLIGLSRALDLILTGRPIDGKEALNIGLANRLVGCGTGLGQALQYARLIQKFPQECLRVDRSSAYNAVFDAATQKEALDFELDKGKAVLFKESVEGARRFVAGVGRHGSFNLTRNQIKEGDKDKT